MKGTEEIIESVPNKEDEVQNENVIDVFDNGLLIKRIVKPAPKSDNRPSKCDIVCINYKCFLKDSAVAVAEEEGFSFFLGEGDVITGLDASIMFMNIGEHARIEVDARYSFDELELKLHEGWQGIPPNSQLVFHVELLSAMDTTSTSFKFEEIEPLIKKKLSTGDFWFSCENYSAALNTYQIGLKKIRDFIETDDSAFLYHVDFNNSIASCFIKLEQYSEAIPCLMEATKQKPNLKAYHQLAQCYENMGLIEKAFSVLETAKSHFSDNECIRNFHDRIRILADARAVKQKQFYKKMFPDASPENVTKKEKEFNETSPVKKVIHSKNFISMPRLAAALLIGAFAPIIAYFWTKLT